MKTQTSQSYRILLADDEPAVRRAAKMLLQHDGHWIEAVESGEAALALFVPGKFDLVITDNIMQGVSGAQLTALLKQRQPDQPVIMATAFSDKRDILDALQAGVDFVLNKPFSHEELVEAIVHVMSRKIPDLSHVIPLSAQLIFPPTIRVQP